MRPTEALWFGVIATAGGLVYLVLATELALRRGDGRDHDHLSRRVHAAEAGTPGVQHRRRDSGRVAAGRGMGRGARRASAWEPWLLFAIMFLWQLPHTLAVARLYRTDYARAGIHLLPQDNSRGGNASNPIVIAGSLGLIAVGIIPTLLGFTGIAYAVIASALGVWMLAFGVSMVRAPGNSKAARRLLLASIVYLPIVLLVLVLDRM